MSKRISCEERIQLQQDLIGLAHIFNRLLVSLQIQETEQQQANKGEVSLLLIEQMRGINAFRMVLSKIATYPDALHHFDTTAVRNDFLAILTHSLVRQDKEIVDKVNAFYQTYINSHHKALTLGSEEGFRKKVSNKFHNFYLRPSVASLCEKFACYRHSRKHNAQLQASDEAPRSTSLP